MSKFQRIQHTVVFKDVCSFPDNYVKVAREKLSYLQNTIDSWLVADRFLNKNRPGLAIKNNHTKIYRQTIV